ncbi:MAG TPA: PEP-CTERM sorting domain-containing protein [Acetobacteraceae bacterium]
MLKTLSSIGFRNHLRRYRLLRAAAAIAAVAMSATLTVEAHAGPITGDTITQSFVSGFSFWNILSTSPQTIPTGYTFGLSGIPILNMSIDGNGTITMGPNGISCGSGCGYNFSGATFEFTLNNSAPAIASLGVTSNDPSLALSFSQVGARSFDISIGSGGGTTGVDETIAQLNFAHVATPEPGSLVLMGSALIAIGMIRRRRVV